jgi:hypothetical protein
MTAARQTIPPWAANRADDPHWVSVETAASIYFRKTARRVRQMVTNGELKGLFETYFDGGRWWIKLPIVVKKAAGKNGKRASDRAA